jgi:hypothetical protein
MFRANLVAVIAKAKPEALQLLYSETGSLQKTGPKRRSRGLAMTWPFLVARAPMNAVMPELGSGIHDSGPQASAQGVAARAGRGRTPRTRLAPKSRFKSTQ